MVVGPIMAIKKKILFVYRWVSIYPWKIPTPTLKDYNLLKESFDVKLFSSSHSIGIAIILSPLLHFISF